LRVRIDLADLDEQAEAAAASVPKLDFASFANLESAPPFEGE